MSENDIMNQREASKMNKQSRTGIILGQRWSR
ncbi:hypothetical protein BH18ACT16_BH18ACT16_05460 [soil metagenome]